MSPLALAGYTLLAAGVVGVAWLWDRWLTARMGEATDAAWQDHSSSALRVACDDRAVCEHLWLLSASREELRERREEILARLHTSAEELARRAEQHRLVGVAVQELADIDRLLAGRDVDQPQRSGRRASSMRAGARLRWRRCGGPRRRSRRWRGEAAVTLLVDLLVAAVLTAVSVAAMLAAAAAVAVMWR